MSGAKFDYSGLLSVVRDLQGVQAKLPLLNKRLLGRIQRRLPVEARRDIQQEYNLNAGRINKGLSSRQITGGVMLVGEARGIGLVNFSATYRGRSAPGVSVQVTKKKGRVTLPRTFIPKNRNPNQVFIRRELLTGTGKVVKVSDHIHGQPSRGGSSLVRLYGPSVAQMLKKEDRVKRLGDFTATVVEEETIRLLGR